MNNDPFLEQLRRDAQPLRYQPPDDFVWTRLAARVREGVRISRRQGVAHLLAGWLRPVAASLAALAVVASLAAGYIAQQSHEASTSLETLTSSTELNTTLEDVYSLAE